MSNRICPLFDKDTVPDPKNLETKMPLPDDCLDARCRFRVGRKCAIVDTYLLVKKNNELLTAIAKK